MVGRRQGGEYQGRLSTIGGRAGGTALRKIKDFTTLSG
jgi:hypothetical protein